MQRQEHGRKPATLGHTGACNEILRRLREVDLGNPHLAKRLGRSI